MSNASPVITVENLSKRYRLGTSNRDKTLVGTIRNAVTYPIRNFREIIARRRFEKETSEDSTVLWALKDVSFTVKEGEVLGIIGHNGAGKSSLLKLLSRITYPTTGKITLQGRVSSLLEVGTGFHSELSGRDNVYMNGTVLGMTHKEVEAKFDEIIAFSGVEKHIDTPIKYYSSGMKVRLAFAVAAHLDPEILIIDEVLAVGDLAFQQKCLGKMNSVAKSGRTVLFVSHNMVAVEGLCNRCLLMSSGSVVFDGDVQQAVERYRSASMKLPQHTELVQRKDRKGAGTVRFTNLTVNEGAPIKPFEPVIFDVTVDSAAHYEDIVIAIQFCKGYREVVTTINNRHQGVKMPLTEGENHFRVVLPKLYLAPGHYLIDLWVGSMTVPEDQIVGAMKIEVEEKDIYNSGLSPKSQWHGDLLAEVCSWEVSVNHQAS